MITFIFSMFSFSTQAENSNGSTLRSRLGVNIDGIADWSTSLTFVDAMKSSREWGNVNSPWVHDVIVDHNGWPTTDAGVIVMTGLSSLDISGVYKLSFKGAASTTVVANSNNFTTTNYVYKDGVYTMDLTLQPYQSNLFISFKNTVGGVKDVKLIRPGYPAVNPPTFTNEFVKALEPFSTIRFMNFLDTNNQNGLEPNVEPWYDIRPIEWANRKLATDSSQASNIGLKHGGAWEYVVELANLTGKDIWVNVPANPTKEYMTELAKLLNDNVREDVHIYVEYSNEVWNWGFSQAQLNANYLAKNDPIANNYILQYAKAVAEMSNTFKSVFGDKAMNDRLRIVCAWQFGWSPADYQPREMLEYIKTYYGEPSSIIYTLAVAPYFYESKPEDSTSIQIVQDSMIDNSDKSVYSKRLLLNLAKSYNLAGGVTCYEGGPHHLGQVDTNLATRIAAHRDPAMKDIVVRDLKTNWFDIGGGLFMYFTLSGTPSKYGSWGLVETFSNLNTPKYNAILEMYNSETPEPLATHTPTPSATPDTTPTPTAPASPKPTSTPTLSPTKLPTTSPTIPPVSVGVTGVKLSKISVALLKGKTTKLIATISPAKASNKKVTWKSNNPKIATVNASGIIKGIKKGTTYIFVYTVDGKKSAKCKVEIK